MSSQWWESAARAEAELHHVPDPRADEFDPADDTLPASPHRCDDPATCPAHTVMRAAVDKARRLVAEQAERDRAWRAAQDEIEARRRRL